MAGSLRTFVVVNPASAAGKTGREWPEIKALLDATLEHWSHGLTTGPWTAPGLVRNAVKEGCEQIVALGGDGTNNEVVNGLFENGMMINPDIVFSTIPKGTGGDFKRVLGFPKEAAALRHAAIERLKGRSSRKIDLGHIRMVDHDGKPAERYFINFASLGIGGNIDYNVNHTTKALGGKMSFLLGTVRALRKYKMPVVRYKVDGRDMGERRLIALGLGNGQYAGGGMWLCPHSSLDDGWFDAILLASELLAFPGAVTFMRRLYKGKHEGMEHVETFRVKTLEAESKDVVMLDVDGEAPGRLPATFTILPRILSLKTSETK